jgi:hypothetical protein
VLRAMGWYLADPFVEATFSFYKKELTGQVRPLAFGTDLVLVWVF